METITLYHECIDNNLISQEKMLSYVQTVSRDNARTPIQWDDSENAGFTTGTPWIKINPNYVKINAKEQVSRPDSVFNYYKKLIYLRKDHEIIVHGKFVPLLEDNDAIYAYERQLYDKKLTVACDFTKEEVKCDLFDNAAEGEELISNYEEHKAGVLKPYEARVVLVCNN